MLGHDSQESIQELFDVGLHHTPTLEFASILRERHPGWEIGWKDIWKKILF
jgi:hypothetical protein